MKRILYYVCVVFFMICNLFNFNVSAKNSPSIQWGDFVYEIENDAISIMYYVGNEEQVVIPNEIDGIAVKCIGSTWGIGPNNSSGGLFNLNKDAQKNVKKITIPVKLGTCLKLHIL